MIQKIKQIMADIFEIPVEEIDDDSNADTIAQWDSLKHMALVLAIEEEFEIMFEEHHIIEIVSYQKILETVQELKT